MTSAVRENTTSRRRWASVAVLSASLLVITMDMTILNIAIPEMAADLRPSTNQLLWIVDIYSLVLAGLLVSMSTIGDRWGRKRMLLLGYAIFGVTSALVLFASSAEAVIGLRALLGVGGAMIMPTTLSLIRTVFTDPAERATALAIWAAVSGVGAAIGPVVGGMLLQFFSWQAAFLVNVPLMVAALVAGWLILPEARSARPGRWDGVAAALSLAGMVGLVWSIKHFANQESLAVVDGWAVLGVSAVLLGVFAHRCLTRTDPLLDLRLFKSRSFSAGVIAALGTMFAMAAALLLLAQWMQVVVGDGPIMTGVKLLPIAVAGAVASLAAPWAAARIGARSVLSGGLVVAGLGMIVLFPGDLGYPQVLVGLSLIGVGMGSLAIASAMIMSGTPDDKAGNAAALEETSYDLGNVLGVAILGSVAALFFRDRLGAGVPEAARESVASAMAVAQETGMAGLARAAGVAFTDSTQVTSLVGGILMLLVGAIVFAVTPKDTDITKQSH